MTIATRPRALLLENIHSSAVNTLQSHGFEVEHHGRSLSENELFESITRGRFSYVGIRSRTRITRSLLERLATLPEQPLRAIGCFCIGTDQVDVRSAIAMDICVFNAPRANTRSVAELVISHIISLSRHVSDRNMEIHREGTWHKTAVQCREVRGKTLGIVGYGNIGTQLSVLAEALGLRIVFFDLVPKLPIGNARPVETLEHLLEQSDFVSIHVSLNETTRNLIGAEQLARMKRGAYLINTSRGIVVDIGALRHAVETQHLGGCALDVYPEEPSHNGLGLFESCPLRGLPNTILTPHIGGSTEEAQYAIGVEVATHFVRHAQSHAVE